jgi:RNA polymerase sigma-70 factor (ECF subfamily)
MNNMNVHSNQYSDEEVIGRIRSGETALYEIIIRRYNPVLYKTGRSYGFNHEDTEDLMQEAYVNAYFSLSSFAGKASFKTWLTRIMLNLCYHKKQKFSYRYEVATGENLNEKSTPMFQQNPHTEHAIVNKELNRVLEKAVTIIPEDYRMVFSLRELNGMSVAETAELLNISESNVKVRLNRAKAMLKEEIGKLYSPQEIFEFNLVYCDRMVERVMGRISASNV